MRYQAAAARLGLVALVLSGCGQSGFAPVVAPPPPPDGVTLTCVSDTVLRVTWEDDRRAITYVVERSTAGGPFERISREVIETVFTDEEVTPGVEYAYRVRGVNGFGSSDPSEPVNAVAGCPEEDD
jgi:hypothetical protein